MNTEIAREDFQWNDKNHELIIGYNGSVFMGIVKLEGSVLGDLKFEMLDTEVEDLNFGSDRDFHLLTHLKIMIMNKTRGTK